MRELLILTGPQGTGKTTFVKRNNLEDHCVSLDTFRTLMGGYGYDLNGNETHSKVTSKSVLDTFKKAVKTRMEKGEFLVIDCMNLNSKDYKFYLHQSKIYGYDVYYKKFTSTVEESVRKLKVRGKNIVDLETLERCHRNQKNLSIPSSIKEIKNLKDLKTFNPPKKYDLSSYNIYIIGDIHGCFNELDKFIKEVYNPEDMFIFVGDYIDRGYNNVGVINLLRDLYNNGNKNVILLEGNHERWLRYWSQNENDLIKSREFRDVTGPEFEVKNSLGIPALKRSQARSFCHKLQMFSYIQTNHGTVYITHGGSNFIQNNSKELFPADFYIKGQGKYIDLDYVYDQGSKIADIVIHGHRNIQKYKETVLTAAPSDGGVTTYFNVEGSIELGGDLRYVKIPKDKNSKPELRYIKSDFDYRENIDKLVKELRSRPADIKERPCSNPDVSSFNFTKEVFYKQNWTSLNCKARGLFVNTKTNKIVGRGYSKFFNYGERPESNLDGLDYPLRAYNKDNGYLGILYVENGKFVFNTKSGDLTDLAARFREIFNRKMDIQDMMNLKKFLQDNNLSATFEVMIPDRENLVYFEKEDKLSFLDFIHNSVKFKKAEKSLRVEGLKCFTTNSDIEEITGVVKVLYNKQEVLDFFEENATTFLEGFVIEDSKGFMFKWKAPIYQALKCLRTYKDTGNRSTVFSTLSRYNILDSDLDGLNITKTSLKDALDHMDTLDSFPDDLTVFQNMFIN